MAYDYKMKDGSFDLHQTKEKKKENSPDYFGTAMINGVEYRLSGWVKTSKAGNVYVGGYIAPDTGSQGQTATPEQAASFLQPQGQTAPIEKSPWEEGGQDTGTPIKDWTKPGQADESDGLPF